MPLWKNHRNSFLSISSLVPVLLLLRVNVFSHEGRLWRQGLKYAVHPMPVTIWTAVTCQFLQWKQVLLQNGFSISLLSTAWLHSMCFCETVMCVYVRVGDRDRQTERGDGDRGREELRDTERNWEAEGERFGRADRTLAAVIRIAFCLWGYKALSPRMMFYPPMKPWGQVMCWSSASMGKRSVFWRRWNGER